MKLSYNVLRFREKKFQISCLLIFGIFGLILFYHHNLTVNKRIPDSDESINSNNTTKLNYKKVDDLKSILLWQKFFTKLNWNIAHESVEYIGPDYFQNWNCTVINCFITRNRTFLHSVDQYDAILYEITTPLNDSMKPQKRSPHQAYIFATMEPTPYASYLREHFRKQSNFFNWTMTYRFNSDLFWPYSFTLLDKRTRKNVSPLKTQKWREYDDKFYDANLLKKAQAKPKKIAWFVSRCGAVSNRDNITKGLQKSIDVDVYGGCGSLNFSGDHRNTWHDFVESNYKFYLSFENSLCPDYVTEKFFRFMLRNIVPIVLGGANYSNFAPPHSYINVEDFETVEDLAKYLLFLDENPDEYIKYFWWKRYYIIKEPPQPFCQICEKLHNKNLKAQYYGDISDWFFDSYNCRSDINIKL